MKNKLQNKFLMAVSAIVLMGAAPAMAAGSDARAQADVNANNPDHQPTATVTQSEVREGWENTKDAVSDAARATGDAVENAYLDAKRALTRDNNAIGQPVRINARNTADYLIGQDVRNSQGETVAKVEDIILDSNGEAQLLVLKDGGFFGLGGKKVALNYDQAVRHQDTGDVILPVSKPMIDRIAEFSYDSRSTGDNIRVIPQGGVSVAHLMGGDILNNNGEKVADIDDISFQNGEAEYLLLSFGKVLKMGGEKAVIDFKGLEIVPEKNGKANLRLSAQQSAELATFKKDM